MRYSEGILFRFNHSVTDPAQGSLDKQPPPWQNQKTSLITPYGRSKDSYLYVNVHYEYSIAEQEHKGKSNHMICPEVSEGPIIIIRLSQVFLFRNRVFIKNVDSVSNTRVFRPRACSEPQVGGMRQTFSYLSKFGGTTNFKTVFLWPSLVSIYNSLVDFRKFANFILSIVSIEVL